MNARIIVRDDGDLTAPRLYDAHHDLAPQPQPGYVLEPRRYPRLHGAGRRAVRDR